MKEIHFQGATLQEPLSGIIDGVGEFSALKVNRKGMLLETTGALSISRRYGCSLHLSESTVECRVIVREVLIKKTEDLDNEKITFYQAAVEFLNLDENALALIDGIIENALESDIPELRDLEGEARRSKFQSHD